MIIVSPFARRGWIDHDVMDHTSIMKFIADNWGLPYLTNREARAGNMTNAFDFTGVSAAAPGSPQALHEGPGPVLGEILTGARDRVVRGWKMVPCDRV